MTLTLRRAGRACRFTVCAAWADEEIARAFAQGAVALAEGAWLALEAEGTAAHHVVVGPSVAVTRQPDPAAACRTPA